MDFVRWILLVKSTLALLYFLLYVVFPPHLFYHPHVVKLGTGNGILNQAGQIILVKDSMQDWAS